MASADFVSGQFPLKFAGPAPQGQGPFQGKLKSLITEKPGQEQEQVVVDMSADFQVKPLLDSQVFRPVDTFSQLPGTALSVPELRRGGSFYQVKAGKKPSGQAFRGGKDSFHLQALSR